MALLPRGPWLRTSFPGAVRALCALLAVGLAAAPCRGDEENIFYWGRVGLRIPFTIDPGDRQVQQVLLHVSENLGRSYQHSATAHPDDRGFNFQARHDGWHYFIVQTRDRDNRLYPPALDGVAPGLKVYIDTSIPDVALRALPESRPNEIGVEWDIHDDMPDLSTLTLEYRAPGQRWMPRGIQRVQSGQLNWNPGLTGPVEVRLQVKDRAGNLGERTILLRGGSTGLPRDAAAAGPRAASTPEKVRKVNSTHISLDYKIDDVGPSDISIIEVYVKKDGGSWKKYPKEASRKPPFAVDVEGEGRYGFSLVAKSGVGLGEEPPHDGDPPQVWMEVDLTKPAVEITGVVVGRGADTGNLTITWKATDKNLSREPISIFYATKPEGPWTPVPGATNYENTGSFVWRMQGGLPYEFYMRIEALDEAGNIGEAKTPQTVKVDLSLPRARVIGIEPAKP